MTVIKSVSFANRQGNIIAGKVNMPAGEMRGTAVFTHCFTCSKDSLAAVRIAQNLAEAGIAVLRFDFTGLGQSEGEFASSGFAGNLDDLEDACLWLGNELALSEILIGHSLGGAHLLRADEPSSVPGGLDSGPAPYDFLLAGLGACTAMTLRLYAERKNWPLSAVDVKLTQKNNMHKMLKWQVIHVLII